jgi:hypothetical protein
MTDSKQVLYFQLEEKRKIRGDFMPRGDGTGPRGEGPGTGRGLGHRSSWGGKRGTYNKLNVKKSRDLSHKECALCGKSGEDLSLLLADHKDLGEIMVCRECWGKLYEENRMMLDTSSYRGESEGRGMGRGLGFGRGR